MEDDPLQAQFAPYTQIPSDNKALDADEDAIVRRMRATERVTLDSLKKFNQRSNSRVVQSDEEDIDDQNGT